MTQRAVADQFLYTAASFGNAGSEGFQFVGLPARGASVDDLEQIERHVGYAAPLDMPADPDDATIAQQFPVSTRLLYPDAGHKAVLVSSRYAGRVYRADGQRGKWGNFWVHALLLDATAAPPSLAALALEVPWRTGLSGSEHAAACALELDGLPFTVPQSGDPAYAHDLPLLAGVILRLCGGPPVLLADMGHELALARYARVQPLLPLAALLRLSWSSYEFDGASGYDVVATAGRTQLSMSPGGYFQPGETPAPADATWAASEAARDPARFWRLVEAMAGPAFEPGPLKRALSILKTCDSPEGTDASLVRETLATLRSAPADEVLVAQARRLFDQACPSEKMTNLAGIVSAFDEAKALSDWSGQDGWSEAVSRCAADAQMLQTCFASPPDPRPLAAALREASFGGLAAENASLAAVAAAAPYLDSGKDAGAFVQALQAFLHASFSATTGTAGWVGFLARLARTPRHRPIASALWLGQAEVAGGAWFDAVRTGLRREVPDFESQSSPRLVACLVDSYSTHATQLTWCVDALPALAADEKLPLAALLERLDAQIAKDSDKARRGELATRLVRLHERMPQQRQSADNTLANCMLLDAARDPRNALRLIEDDARFDALGKRASAPAYQAVVEAAWQAAQVGLMDAAAARQLYCKLWKPDVAAELSETVRRSLSSDMARDGAAAYIEQALGGPRGNAAAVRAWLAIVEALALHLAPRLDEPEFERLMSVRGIDPQLRQALRARRATSLRRLPATIGRFVQGVLGRPGDRRGKGR
jgi:hypothetical protein